MGSRDIIHSIPTDSRRLHFPAVQHLPPLSITTLLFAATGLDAPPPHAPGNYGNGSSLGPLERGASGQEASSSRAGSVKLTPSRSMY